MRLDDSSRWLVPALMIAGAVLVVVLGFIIHRKYFSLFEVSLIFMNRKATREAS